MLDNFKSFVAAAEHGSFSSAAKSLGMTISTLSRQVHDLEVHLGADLFHRSRQGLSLTIAGKTYYQECAVYINELNTRIENLQKSINSMEGNLTVAMPTNIGSGPLNPFWERFATRYPQVRLQVHLTDPFDDLSSIPIDVGIQSGARRNSPLIQKRIGEIATVLVAAQNFSGHVPTDLETLVQCNSVAADLFSEWKLVKGGRQKVVQKQHIHTSNDMNVILSLVKSGAGVALLPLSMVHHEIESGTLKRVLQDWTGQPRQIFLIWAYQRTQSVRAKRFQDELLAFLAEQSWFSPERN